MLLFFFSICCMQRILKIELIVLFPKYSFPLYFSKSCYNTVCLLFLSCCLLWISNFIHWCGKTKIDQNRQATQREYDASLSFWIILFVKLNIFILFILLVGGLGILFYFLLLMDFLVCFWLGKLSLYLDSNPSHFILFLPLFFPLSLF